MTIKAQVIADSVSPAGVRLTTLQLKYPRFIHSEFMTHRVFSRNASSSRAIPVERLIKDVIDDPVYPMHWGKNQPGMSADEEHDAEIRLPARYSPNAARYRDGAWDAARKNAVELAQCFAAAGYHKQIVNRLLEPFCHINVVVTATEWSNFFALRCHPGAQPEMRVLAEKIRDAMALSTPNKVQPGHWHLPYVSYDDFYHTEHDKPNNVDLAIRVSVARCARVSYLTQEGKPPNVEDDLKLYERLVGAVPLHASPAEHQATPDTWIKGNFVGSGGTRDGEWRRSEHHGNLRGWVQYRKTLPGECQ